MPFLDRANFARAAAGWLPGRALAELDTYTGDRTLHRATVAADESATLCGAAGCSVTWAKSRRRQRPVFDGKWACGKRCMESIVRSAVRRLAADRVSDFDVEPHRHRVPLGLVLLAQRWITHPQLQAALEHQRLTGKGRIGEHLVEHCGVAPERITRGLAMQWSCPVLTLDGFEPHRMALAMPPTLCAEFGLLPLRVAGSELLYLASAGDMHASVAHAVEQIGGLRVESGLLSEPEMAAGRRRLEEARSVTEHLRSATDLDDLVAQITRVLDTRQPLAAHVVRVYGRFWLRVWLEEGALSGTARLPRSPEVVEDYLFQTGMAC